MRRLFPSLLALVFFAESGIAQEPVIRTQTTVVLAPTLVMDGKGKLIYGLHAEDFIIDDNGAAQDVHLDEAPEAPPVSLVVAVQRGGRALHEFRRMQGLGTMLDPLIDTRKTEVAIVEFDSHVLLGLDFTNDGSLVHSKLASIAPGDNGAAILDAVNYSVKLLDKKSNNHQRVLLLISETRDHGSGLKLSDVATTIANSNTVTYTLAFSPSLSEVLDDFRGPARNSTDPPDWWRAIVMSAQASRKNIPKAIAFLTGGEYELFKSGQGFDMRMNQFDNHLYSRYLLSFEPKDPQPGFHRIQVRLRHPAGATVLARTGYWVEPKLSGASETKVRP